MYPVEKTQIQVNNRQDKATCGHETVAGTQQGWLHPVPKHRVLHVGCWKKVSRVKSHEPKNWRSEPQDKCIPLCFNKEHNKENPASGGKTECDWHEIPYTLGEEARMLSK